jgi:predicted nuclease of predicted toxin-antitoxin system
MSFAILIDMNLSPHWVGWFEEHGWPALHWSAVGDPRATDREILAWARENQRVLFTHDLDFGAVLASSSANSPSVIQLRANDVTPAAAGGLILGALVSLEIELRQGALVTVDEDGRRVRILPLRSIDAR